MARRWGYLFRDALAMAEERATDLFGGAPPGWVAMAVARAYADCAFDRRTHKANALDVRTHSAFICINQSPASNIKLSSYLSLYFRHS